MRNIPKIETGRNQRIILVLCLLSLLFFVLAKWLPLREESAIQRDMIRASKLMLKAIEALRECKKEKGLILNEKTDPNQTGLIGLKFSPLTTSIGNLEAKRTTTNPNFAALIVFLLKEAGVKRGDTIAVGASSSFPALIVAVLSAAKVMDLKTLMICSLGASQWGANDPNFNWLHMQNCLLRAEIFTTKPIAFSIGGEKDTGENMNSKARSLIIKQIQESRILLIYESNLRRNVEIRMHLYEKMAGKAKIKAFINIGGNWSNLGEDSRVLKLKPGLVKIGQFQSIEKRGVIYEMAYRKIPIIHLLYIRGLVQQYGLPWDPIPLPKPGEGNIYQLAKLKQFSFFLLALIYIILIIIILIFRNKFK